MDPTSSLRELEEGFALSPLEPGGLASLLEASGRPAGGPRAHSAPVLLFEAGLKLPALDEPDPDATQEPLALAVAQLLDRCLHAADLLGGVPLGLADLQLLCCWPLANGGLADGTKRIVRLARFLAVELRELGEIRGVRTELRQVVSAGTATFGRFGGLAGRWPGLLSGVAAQRLTPAWAACRHGELVLPSELANTLDPSLPRAARRDGLVALDIGGVDFADIDDIATPTHEQRPSSSIALAPCTLATFAIGGIDPERGDPGRRLHAASRSLQRTVRKYRGALLELRHDHRGLMGYAAFNAEGGRAARAAVRALRFGHDLGQALSEQGLEVPVGVATGRVWLWHRTQEGLSAIVGSTVMRAEALLRPGSPDMTCDRPTLQLARSRAVFEDEGFLDLPGARQQHVFLVEQVAPSRAERWRGASGMVGRRSQLALLDQCVGEFMAGSAVVLMIEGEEGAGKSRLVDEAVARLRTEEARVFVAYGIPGGAAAPLTPWRSVVLQLLGLNEPVDPIACQERLARLARGTYRPDLDLLATLLPLPRSGDREARCLVTGQLVQELERLVEALHGGHPLAIVLEDAQWLDSASWSLVRELAAHVEELFVVAALRSDGCEGELAVQRLAALPETTVMVLRGLASEDLPRLVERELGVTGLPPELVAWLHGVARGNPRVCLEWVKQLLDDGDLELERGVVVRAIEPARLAARGAGGLEGLLERRSSALERGWSRTLAVAVAAGGVFETGLLASVHPDKLDASSVSLQLEGMAAAGLVLPAPGRSERAWLVAHPVVARSVGEVLEPAERQHVHAAIAAWYEAEGGELAPHYPMMASQWLAGGQPVKALDYLERAGEQAMRAGAITEAARHFQQALTLVGAGDAPRLDVPTLRRSRWERGLGDARYACGELDRCAVHWERSLRLLGFRLPSLRWVQAGSLSVKLLVHLAHRVLPQAWLLARGHRHPALLEASLSAERLAERYYYSADLLALGTASVLSANLADRLGERGRNARPYASMAVLTGLLGLSRLSERLYQRARRIGMDAPDPPGLAVAYYTRSAHFAGLGQWERALELGEASVVQARAAAAWQEEGVAHTIRAMCHYYPGRFGLAEASYCELLAVARERYNAQHEAWALYGAGECQLQTGRLHEAARSVQQALAVLRNIEDHASRLICHGLLASIHLRLGQLDRAREAVDLAWPLALRVPVPFVISTLDGYAGLAEASLAIWERERGAGVDDAMLGRRARRAVALLGRYARVFPMGQPRYLLAVAELARLQGKPRRAVRILERALQAAEGLGLDYDLGLACAALSGDELLPAERRGVLRTRALAIFAALGCSWHARRVQDMQGPAQQGQSQ